LTLFFQGENEYLLESGKVGYFTKGMPIEEALQIANEHYSVKKSSITLEGHKVQVWDVHDAGELLLQFETRNYDYNKTLWRTWVKSDRYKTVDGIGIGSSISEVLDVYSNVDLQIEGGFSINVDELDLGLMLDGSNVPDSWWSNGMKDSDFPKSTKIRLIIVI